MLTFREMLSHRADYWQQIRHNKLVTNASAYISGYVLQKAASFLLIPLWARFLTPEDYGITGTLMAYQGVLSTLLVMGLYSAAVRHYYDYANQPDRQRAYVTSTMLFQIVVPGIIIVGLDWEGASLWARYTANTIPFDPYVRLVLWYTFIDIVGQIPLSLYQAQQKAKQFVFAQYGRFLLGVVANLILVVALRLGAYGVLVGQLVSALVVTAIVVCLAIRNWFSWRVAWVYVREGLAFGLPLVPHALASWVMQAASRLILERYIPLAELGLYNFGFTLGMAMQFIVTGINQAWSPYYYRLMQNDLQPEGKIVKVVSTYIALVGGICLSGALFAGEIIHILMPPAYYEAIPYIAPVLIGYLLLGFYYFAGMPLFYYKKTNWLPFLTSIAAIVNIVLNIWLVPNYGAIASAWVTTITYGLLFSIVFLAGRRCQKIAYPLLRYGLVFSIILLSAIINTQLDASSAKALCAKATLMITYTITVYATLKPYILAKGWRAVDDSPPKSHDTQFQSPGL